MLKDISSQNINSSTRSWSSFWSLCAICALVANVFQVAMASEGQAKDEKAAINLFDFNNTREAWRSIDDSVMGGVSASSMRIKDGAAIFEGDLSLENNGGFASVRSSAIESSIAGYEGIVLRVKGDGNRYQARIRTSGAFDGPSYQLSFDTKKDEWTEVKLNFTDFKAAFRGRKMPDYPPLVAAKIRTVGLLIADKQEGRFKIEIEYIHAYGK